jgi:hypothetical protein
MKVFACLLLSVVAFLPLLATNAGDPATAQSLIGKTVDVVVKSEVTLDDLKLPLGMVTVQPHGKMYHATLESCGVATLTLIAYTVDNASPDHVVRITIPRSTVTRIFKTSYRNDLANLE